MEYNHVRGVDMEYKPGFELNFIADEAFAARMDHICRQLDDCRVSGYFTGCQEAQIYYEYFPVAHARGSVVLLHGMSEFTKKHYELAYYLMEQGYSVFLYDHRGHGLSQRLADRPDLIHVDRFSDYVQDLHIFVQTIVLPNAAKPLYLYGHSMGGAVSLFYLAEHHGVFRKAVLSAPLFVPRLPAPLPLATISAWIEQKKHGAKSKLSHSREFVAKIPPEWENDPKCSRNKYMMQLRLDNPAYRTTPMSAGFALHALYLTPRLLRIARKIKTPHLLISGQADTVVQTKPQHRYGRRAPMCDFVSIPGGKHAMMCDDMQSVAIHTHLVLDYLKEETL